MRLTPNPHIALALFALFATSSCDDTATTSLDDNETDDDNDDTSDSYGCDPDDIAKYLDTRWAAHTNETFTFLCPPKGQKSCYALAGLDHIPCGWRDCAAESADITVHEFGKCGFCDSDADCRHPNSGFGPNSRCDETPVYPGVKFCVEETGKAWQPGDCSAYDIDQYYLYYSELTEVVVCPPDSSGSACSKNYAQPAPCGWGECAGNSENNTDDEDRDCNFCAHDGHCPTPTKCTGVYSDGTRFCENP